MRNTVFQVQSFLKTHFLADGEVKSKKAAPTSPNMVSSTTSSMPSTSASSSTSMCSFLSHEDEGKIRDCINKMQLIRQQTEDLNPLVSMNTYICQISFCMDTDTDWGSLSGNIQCGNFRICLPLRFYVKSILVILKPKKLLY